ncbi:hypothetical protein E8E12_008275 [Didymella heteroderae]|uniref:Heterokaryon incompatibility domain-containing protein n=1 Tax=Didymella heteroderae TaxID=1769908 RepID=A0A9P4WT98_9PLEO|nr:hypothetical protein E8E12_008275 [Didymella heteroderae]
MLADPLHLSEAGGPSRFQARVIDNVHLRVSGFFFDEIAWKSSEIESSDFLLTPENADKLLLDKLWKTVTKTAYQLGLRLDYYTFTLALVHCYNNTYVSVSVHHTDDFDAYRKMSQALRDRRQLLGERGITHEEYRAATWISKVLHTRTRGRCMFLTRSGKVGLGPGQAIEVGDFCAVFIGAQVPFVLASGNDDRYRLVGECYVQGVMGGELLTEFDATEIVLE